MCIINTCQTLLYSLNTHYMAHSKYCMCALRGALFCLRPHRAEPLSDAFVWRLSVWRLTYVCLLRTLGSNSRIERPRKTKIGTEVAHVIRHADTTFNVKGQLVDDVLSSQHDGTGATWRITAKILLTCRGRRHTVSPRAQHVTAVRKSRTHDHREHGNFVRMLWF